ncbi:MAG TPA: RnfH family protein [Moraxellaceae bacterium]|nr:RnfH family protein [Moraxellaceae bacterium]
MADAEMITVEVVYGLPDEQVLLVLQVPSGTTVREAARCPELAARCPGLDVEHAALGIFGKLEKDPDHRVLRAGERVEIYRPLLIDPKEARRLRAERAKSRRGTPS